MSYFVLVLFVIFCAYCWKYLTGNGKLIKNPFPGQAIAYLYITGPQLFFVLMLLTGLLRFGFFGLPLDLSAIKLMVLILFILWGLSNTNAKVYFSWPLLFYTAYLIWIFIGVFYSPHKDYAIRTFLKYLFPLVLLLFAMKININKLLSLKIMDWLIKASLIYTLVYFSPWFPLPDLLCTWATFADYSAVAVLMSMGMFFLVNKKIYLFYALLFALFPVVRSIRTGILAMSIGLVVFLIVRYRLRSLPYLIVAIGFFILIVLYVPQVRDKMFIEQMTSEEIFENRESLSMDDVNTDARQAMWDWALAYLYEPNQTIGSGLGSLQASLYDEEVNPFPFNAIHSDYVQILCDSGNIGFILYLLTFLAMFIHCIVIFYKNRNDKTICLFALLSASSLAAVMTSSITSNVVNFTAASYIYPYAFYGICLTLLNQKK